MIRTRFLIVALAAATALFGVMAPAIYSDADAKIRCNGPYQVIRGEGEIATPYCQDAYLAQVARGYGIRVTARQIRRSVSRKEEICRAIGHDGRVNDLCIGYRNDECIGIRCQ